MWILVTTKRSSLLLCGSNLGPQNCRALVDELQLGEMRVEDADDLRNLSDGDGSLFVSK
jgi:hypothetical protein